MSLLRALTICSLLTLPLSACCTAWKMGGSPVQIAAQEVLIVWDEENKMEHFVRRANFQAGKAPKDFGFLVPTPTQPKLSETPDQVFTDLGEIIQPKVQIEKKTEFSFMPLSFLFFTASMGTKDSESAPLQYRKVEVLDRAFVGGYEAVVLRASETGELLQWLEKNDYDARPALRDWLTPYVDKKWIITAFKYASGTKGQTSSLSRASVCMSFEANAPFFPYRVPSDIRVKPENGSLLRLYYAGQKRIVGEFGGGTDRTWKALIKFSDRDDRMLGVLDQLEYEFSDPNETWLTAFEDNTWPGGAKDLYFSASTRKDAIVPDPIIRAQITTRRLPLDLLLLGLVLAGYLYKKRSHKA